MNKMAAPMQGNSLPAKSCKKYQVDDIVEELLNGESDDSDAIDDSDKDPDYVLTQKEHFSV